MIKIFQILHQDNWVEGTFFPRNGVPIEAWHPLFFFQCSEVFFLSFEALWLDACALELGESLGQIDPVVTVHRAPEPGKRPSFEGDFASKTATLSFH